MKYVFNSLEVDTDSIFVALTTGVRDGNEFAEDAFKRGAQFLILSEEPDFEIPSEKFIVVPDTLEYITNLARQKFQQFKASGVKTISLTGSIGKTTTKDFLVFLLNLAGKKVYGTIGNFNNHIGLPFTILNSPVDIDFLVLEMGMNNIGEIAYLNNIANCDVKIITDISAAHIGNFKNGLKDIAKAKGEILNESKAETIFITKPDLLFLQDIASSFKGKINLISEALKYEIKNGSTYFEVNDKKYFINQVRTKEWLKSILYGFKVLEVFNISFPEDISNFTLYGGRGGEITLKNGCVLIDESYNASTSSMINAIDTLNLLSGKKLAVIGEMRESSEEEHQKVISFLKEKNMDVILIGEEFIKFKAGYDWFKNTEDLIANFDYKKKYDYILVKSSNSVNLNLFVEKMKDKV